MINSLNSYYKDIEELFFFIAHKLLGFTGILEEMQLEGPVTWPEPFTQSVTGDVDSLDQ